MAIAVFGRGKEFVASVFLAVITLSNVIMVPGLVPFLHNGYQDFTIFYAAAKMVRSGQTVALYDLSAQYRMQRTFAPEVPIRQAALPYNHPPFEALVFVPFTFLPYGPAYLLWTALNLTFAATGLALLREYFPEIERLSWTFLTLAAAGFSPVMAAIAQGQDCLLLLVFYVLALAAFQDERDVTAGSLLALGLFRFQFVLPLVLMLAVRRWRLLLGFVPVAALLTVVSALMLGWHGVFDYARFILNLEQKGGGGSIVAAGMPNLRGMIASLSGAGARPSFIAAATALASVAVVLVTVWRIRTRPTPDHVAFALATVAAILVTYHALAYDLSLLLPAILLIFSARGNGTRKETQADIVIFVSLFLIPRFELFGSLMSRLIWFALLLGWLFRKFGSASPSRHVVVPTGFANR